MKRALVLSALIGACGAARPVPTHPTAGDEVRPVGDASLVVLTRPLAERFLVQLWIDAGSIDAAEACGHPEVASLAAWVAEQRAEGVHARVVPDGTVLEMESDALAPAIDAIEQALAARDPSEEELAHARATLRERRRGRAPDPLAELELEAATALLGPLDPLGVIGPGELESDDDATPGAVTAFLRDHYGLERGRWVVVGPIDLDDAQPLFHHAGPRAAGTAPRRQIEPAASAVGVPGEPAFAVAALSPRSAPELGGAWGLAGASVGARHARFATPCGELGLAVGAGVLAADDHVALAFAIHLGTSDATLGDGHADAERAGLAFVARPERCEADATAARVVVVRGPSEADARADATELEATFAQDGPALPHADVDGRTALLALTIDGGAGEDAPSAHGATAAVARALAESCGARAEVEPERVVLEAVLDSDRLDASLGAVLRCLLVDAIPEATLSAARATALDALDAEATFLDHASRVLAPGAPGLVAPAGSPAGLAGATLTDTLARLRGTARLHFGVVAPTAPGPGVARALAALPVGSAPPGGRADPGPSEAHVAVIAREDVEIVLALRGPARADGQRVVRLLSSELGGGPLFVARAAAGAFTGASWVAIAVRGDAAALAHAAEHFDAARARVAARLVETVATAEAADDGRSPRATARRLAGAGPEAPSDTAATRALLDAPAMRVFVRPGSPPVRRR